MSSFLVILILLVLVLDILELYISYKCFEFSPGDVILLV